MQTNKLMNCPDCGHQISKHAATCPACGRRIAFGIIMFWAVFWALFVTGFLGALLGGLAVAIFQLANLH
jgi:hypothetical protein